MSKRLSLEEKACRVIEILVSDDFCEDLEAKIVLHDDTSVTPADVKLMNRKFCTIYELTHGANPNHGCYNVHDNWRKLIEQKYNYFRRKGYFKTIKNTGKEKWHKVKIISKEK